ncbi:hypothetical protein Pint_35693 [Pistacia integerrima]|uniref:Uncharacterized protein n=1 Tax=Pistacia integerrima TaxID=434235 RepID=A0ACC0Y2Q5_9ROSI|nr:hypothetical protein Pint_35693 [Pistacia integerrima]
MVLRFRGFSHEVPEQAPTRVKNRNQPKGTETELELHFPLAEMQEDRYEKKGTETKLKNRILPQDENDILSEKTQECIIDLKVRLCCESCNNQLKKILKDKGLEMLTVDEERHIIKVRGSMDIAEFISDIQDKLKKDVEVVNNEAVMFPPKAENGSTDEKDEGKGGDSKKVKDDGASIKSTVVNLKTRLDCDSCIRNTRRAILSIKGVERVLINAGENLVVVEGTMNVEKLTPYLKKKIKKSVEIVPIKKENSNEDKGYCSRKMVFHCRGFSHNVLEQGPCGVKSRNPPKGAMEVTEFISYIQDKLKKNIEVVNNAAVMFPTKTENGATCIKDELTGRDRKIIKDDGAMVKSTMVFLKIRLHCDHCIQKIRRLILRIKGVERVSISAGENLVVVEGTMNVEKLTPYLKEKIKRSVEIVPIKNENSKEDKGKDEKE